MCIVAQSARRAGRRARSARRTAAQRRSARARAARHRPPARRPPGARSASATCRSPAYAISAASTIGAKFQPASTGTAAPSRFGTNKAHNCDDRVLIRYTSRVTIRSVTSLLSQLLAAVAPPGCLACRAAVAGAGERLCADCTRALPWLRRGCPRCGLPTHRARRMSGGVRGVPALVGAGRLRGRRPRPRRRPEVPRGAARRRRDGGAHGREPSRLAPRHRRRARAGAGGARAPPRARVRPRAGSHAGAVAKNRAAARGLPDPRGPGDRVRSGRL